MTESSPRKQRGKGKPWKPGQSGNPAGRPAGSGLAGELRKAVAERAPELVAALIAKALGGDVQAGRVLLDRVLPAMKPESAAVHIHGLSTGSLTERAQAALAATADGQLAPDVAAALVAAVSGLARIRETDELEARIRALEEQHDKSE